MRIITGSARGTRLATLEGQDTRPTAERVKEGIFSALQFELTGRKVLDLFCGSGQMALEALSRGAASAVLVDASRSAVDIAMKNAQRAHLYERCRILPCDYKAFLKSTRDKFDLVLLDPPYEDKFMDTLLGEIAAADIVEKGGVIVCETWETGRPQCELFTKRKAYRYGKIYVTVYQNGESIL